MPLSFFQRRRRYEDAAHALYGALVSQARQPVFYEELGVPDTVDGRYDMLVVHLALILRRLSKGTPNKPTDRRSPSARLAQELFDLMFKDMDRNLREMGVSDYKVGKEIKKMARAYYGRALSYETGFKDGSLEKALTENVYRANDKEPEPRQITALANYMRREAEALEAVPEERLLAGLITFGSALGSAINGAEPQDTTP
ncbi:MAG: ubiquinol-cytochrome C chaperone family protein [Rhodospirillum sp.]|nr:ubiquinol-cytochrome C chaperone family protein [Rhodospirillum sp.]MCF8487750.1 ubiquinol-cytochrome C chaperone family protein [Rhodospirillum sp.]MCF8502818.1 ubiquinol-cytochrome C chaperone family protein [Rhodospirillum sp.]